MFEYSDCALYRVYPVIIRLPQLPSKLFVHMQFLTTLEHLLSVSFSWGLCPLASKYLYIFLFTAIMLSSVRLLGCSFLFVLFPFLDHKRKEKTGLSFPLEEFLFILRKSTSSDLERKGSKEGIFKEFLEKRIDRQWAS